MGGNALKNTETKRLDRTDFERVSSVVESRLREAFPGARIAVIQAYFSKADFGDLDILIDTESVQEMGGGTGLQKLAHEVFHATDIFKNGSVLSFDFRSTQEQIEPGFQIDVISIPQKEFNFALNYFSYNDLGNLIGRTAHKMGFKFGHDGLSYCFREGNYMFREINISRDFDKSLEFLGYGPDEHKRGFDALPDIFNYVTGSEFFSRDIFLLENRSYNARVRDAKRKTYTEFLDWIEVRPDLKAYPYPQDKNEWLPRAFEWFPDFKIAYKAAASDLEVSRRVKERFNGELVASWTGLQGKELGAVMKHFKESFDDLRQMQKYILEVTPDVMRDRIIHFADQARAMLRPAFLKRSGL